MYFLQEKIGNEQKSCFLQEIVTANVLELAKNKVSSNVVERCFEVTTVGPDAGRLVTLTIACVLIGLFIFDRVLFFWAGGGVRVVVCYFIFWYILLIVLFDCSSSFWLLVLLSFFLYLLLMELWVVVSILLIFPLFGEMIQFDDHIFQMGWFNHQRSNRKDCENSLGLRCIGILWRYACAFCGAYDW